MATLDLGDTKTLIFKLTDQAGSAANSASVILTITQPDGTILTPAITNPPAQTGYYLYDFTNTQAGRHQIYWKAVGAANQAYNDVFDVRPINPAMIFGLDDAKESLRMTSGDTSNDNKLRDYIGAVTNVIESLYGAVVQRTITEQRVGGTDTLSLFVRPVVSITSVTEYIGGVIYTLSQASSPSACTSFSYTFDPTKGSITRRNAAGLHIIFIDEVWVTYVAGSVVIPDNVLMASRELLRFWWQVGQEGRSSARNQATEETVTVVGYAVPRRIVEMLASTPQAPGFA